MMDLLQPTHEILPCLGGPLAGRHLPVVLAPAQRWVSVPDGADGHVAYLVERVGGAAHHLAFIGRPLRASRHAHD